VQSTLDWTWFFSGVTVPVLLCAGWLAGRGPLVAPAPVSAGEPRRSALLDRLAARPAAAAAVVLLVMATLFIGWMQWRPLRSTQQLERSEAASSTAAAFPLARSATHSDPLSIAPYPWLCSLEMDLHNVSNARDALVKATNLQPVNPVTWMDLGLFDFHHRRVASALPEFQRALELDQTMDTTRLTALPGLLQSRAIVAGTQQPPPSVPYCLFPTG
jgi:hypothetical protein